MDQLLECAGITKTSMGGGERERRGGDEEAERGEK